MNLAQKHKDKKKVELSIIATVEEEDIVKEEMNLASQQSPAPVVESEVVPEETNTPEEVVEETVQEETQEDVVEETPIEEQEEVQEPVQEEVAEEVVEEPIQEGTQEEIVEETQEEVQDEVTEEPIQEQVEEVVEEPAQEVVEESVIEEPVVADAVIEELSEEEIAKEPVYQPTFAEKMNIADEDIQKRYDELKNYALRFKKLTWRISKKYDSINLGRFQFVKLSVAGKTLKLNLNMDISEADPKYHCVDKRKTKTYEDVPCQMRIKSDRGLKYAKELIDQCAEKHGLVENPKFQPVNSLELIERHLELGDTDDIIIEMQDDEE